MFWMVECETWQGVKHFYGAEDDQGVARFDSCERAALIAERVWLRWHAIGESDYCVARVVDSDGNVSEEWEI
jgi:hypothetical protein